jgi:hypothetical protein
MSNREVTVIRGRGEIENVKSKVENKQPQLLKENPFFNMPGLLPFNDQLHTRLGLTNR